MRTRRVVILVSALFIAGMTLYLSLLYRQLNTAFHRQDQFIPTRIYSDVTQIAPPIEKTAVEERLKSLGYEVARGEGVIGFTLHPVDYPAFLIPTNHPQLGAIQESARRVTLMFSGDSDSELLQSIQLGGKEVQDIYLEPELVTSLASTRKEIRASLSFENIPSPVWKAIIAIEDQHFLEHRGLDPRGFARAMWVNLKSRRLAQGGSTLTQQLVKQLMVRRGKNIFRKVNELFLAVLLEVAYDKEQILDRYLNEVPLGQVGNMEVRGVAEGAEHFFGRDLKDLNLAEIALMAGLIRGPAFYSPYRHPDRAMARERLVLQKMVETGQIAEAEAKAALSMPIRLAPPVTMMNKAPYFADFVKAELYRQLQAKMTEPEIDEAGFRVYTTLDLHMNQVAQAAVARGVALLEKRVKVPASTRLEGALASVDQTNGYLRALIGGRSYAESTFNRILNMKRQVGSTFKPIVYLTAFLKGRDAKGVPYGPGYPVEDAPWTLSYDHGHQKWSPRNYEKGFLGWIDLRAALAHSINTATARIGWEVGISDIVKMGRALGIESDLPSVPSLSLGVAELSPIELLRVYSTFANHGIQNELTVFRAITKEGGEGFAHVISSPRVVVDPGPTDLLADMLTSIFTDGTAREASVRLGFDRMAAGKTGTTSHHRDAWFAGFTPQLTTVVWTGLDQPEPNSSSAHASVSKMNLTGADAALPIWIDFMKAALESVPPAPFPLSPLLTNVTIDRKTGLNASMFCPAAQIVTEKYVRGTEPNGSSCADVWPTDEKETVAP
jgi:penicillin-binding protein 1B